MAEGWEAKDNRLSRGFEFDTFEQAMVFVNRMKSIIDELDHHPSITIQNNLVHVSTKTHEVDQVTTKDFQLAERVNQLIQGLKQIQNSKEYDPHQVNDSELIDDLRIVAAWYTNQKKSADFRFSAEEIMGLHSRIAGEMIRRGFIPFIPSTEIQKELFAQTVKRVANSTIQDWDVLLHEQLGKRQTKDRFRRTHDCIAQEMQLRHLGNPTEHELEKKLDDVELITQHEHIHQAAKSYPELLVAQHATVVESMENQTIFHRVHDVLDLLSLEKRQQSTTVQTLIFSKEKFKTSEAAQQWAKRHNFRSDKVDGTEDSWRLRQRDPELFDDKSFRTIELTDGVKAVIGKLKEGS